MVCDLQTLDPLCQEKVTEVFRDSGEGGVYYVTNDVLFFKDQVIVPV